MEISENCYPGGYTSSAEAATCDDARLYAAIDGSRSKDGRGRHVSIDLDPTLRKCQMLEMPSTDRADISLISRYSKSLPE